MILLMRDGPPGNPDGRQGALSLAPLVAAVVDGRVLPAASAPTLDDTADVEAAI